MSDLHDAIRTGTVDDIADIVCDEMRDTHSLWTSSVTFAQAIVAARPKPEDVAVGKVAVYDAGIVSVQMPGVLTTVLDPGEFGEFHAGDRVAITKEPSNG